MKNPVDIEVGARIKGLRKSKNMSQTDLAEYCGVSFQQIQKYERGTNRVGSSRLVDISNALDVPISKIFEGLGKHEKMKSDKVDYNKKASDVARDWMKIKDDNLRLNAAIFVRSLRKSK